MARKINSRLRIYGTLQAETPLHVGGYGVDVDTDLPLARNGKNQLYVSGTSITGVLRAWCERNFIKLDENGNPEKDKEGKIKPQEIITEIFGFQEKDKTKVGTKADKSHASFVLIEDAIVTLPKGLQTEIRDGVGINRIYGTAADKSKFDRAILPKGSKLKFEMTVEIDKNEAETKAIFGHLLTALTKEEIRFGASKTRGLGRVKLIELDEIQNQDFSDILSWIVLDEKGAKLTDETAIKNEINKLGLNGTSKQDSPRLEITICWKPRLPLMNKAGYEGIGVDMLPVTSGVGDEKLSLVLAGSSIKGAFRSHAERIVRTVRNEDTDSDFNKQIIVPVVKELFGGKKEKDNPNQPKSTIGLGALSIDDCYSVESFNQEKWREVEQASADKDETYTTFLSKLSQIEKPNLSFYPTQHTAIDRFTGGVAEGALYSVLAPHNIEWQPIKMSLDFGRTQGKDKCCLMLLLLVLRDLAENRLPLGFATNRGMGEVEIQKVEIKGKYQIIWEDGKFIFTDEVQKQELTEEWKKCVA